MAKHVDEDGNASERDQWARVQKYSRELLESLPYAQVDDRDNAATMERIAKFMIAQLDRGLHKNPPARRRNPPLVIWGNPGRTVDVQFDQVLSERAYELAYRHVDDKQDYKHDFAAGTHVVTCLIGNRATDRHQLRGVLLYRPDGQPLWKDFD